MVEYLVASGQQVFVISWRNPDEAQGHFDTDTYAAAVLEARQAVADITRQSALHLNASCSGGIISAGTTRAGGLEVLGSAVDLQQVDVDSCIVAGVRDHIVPWQNAYRSTQLLGGKAKFVLANSGHIQALVNPASRDSRSSYRVAGEHPADSQAFLEQAAKLPGSWWPDYAEWLQERSDDLRPAPGKRGGGGHRALGKAPGTYVLAK